MSRFKYAKRALDNFARIALMLRKENEAIAKECEEAIRLREKREKCKSIYECHCTRYCLTKVTICTTKDECDMRGNSSDTQRRSKKCGVTAVKKNSKTVRATTSRPDLNEAVESVHFDYKICKRCGKHYARCKCTMAEFILASRYLKLKETKK